MGSDKSSNPTGEVGKAHLLGDLMEFY